MKFESLLTTFVVGMPVVMGLVAVAEEVESRRSHEIVLQLEQTNAPRHIISPIEAYAETSHSDAVAMGGCAVGWTVLFGGGYMIRHRRLNRDASA